MILAIEFYELKFAGYTILGFGIYYCIVIFLVCGPRFHNKDNPPNEDFYKAKIKGLLDKLLFLFSY